MSEWDGTTQPYEVSVSVFSESDSLFHLNDSVVWTTVLFIVIEILAGVFGNCVVCLTVYKNKSLRTPMNGLIVNLCVADMVVSLIASPVIIFLLVEERFLTDDTMAYHSRFAACQIQYVCHFLIGTVMLITMLCISLERYHAIAQPFDKGNRWVRIKISIALSWISGIFIAIMGFVMPEDRDSTPKVISTHQLLVQTFLSEFMKLVFVPLSFVCVLVILFLYFAIVYLIQKHAASTDKKLNKPTAKKTQVAPTPDKNSSVLAPNSTILVGLKHLGSDFVVLPTTRPENTQRLSPNFTPADGDAVYILGPRDTAQEGKKFKSDTKAQENNDNKTQRTDIYTTQLLPETNTAVNAKTETVALPVCPSFKPKQNSNTTSRKDSGVNEVVCYSVPRNSAPTAPSAAGEIDAICIRPSNDINKAQNTDNGAAEDVTRFIPKTKVATLASSASDAHEADTVCIRPSAKPNGNAAQIVESEGVTCRIPQTKPSPSATNEVDAVCIRPSSKPKNGPVIEICDREGKRVKVTTTRSEVVGNICVMNNKNKERGKRKVEARSARVTAIVMVAFLACWLPLPAVVIATAKLKAENAAMSETNKTFVVVSLAISFLSAAINPVVYGLVNRQIRNGIIRLAKKYRQKVCKTWQKT